MNEIKAEGFGGQYQGNYQWRDVYGITAQVKWGL